MDVGYILLAVTSSTAVYMHVQVVAGTSVVGSVSVIPLDVELLGNCTCNFLRSYRAVCCLSHTILHSHWQYRRVPASPPSCQHFSSFIFSFSFSYFTIVVLVGVTWHLHVLLIHISPMTKDVEHPNVCLDCISPLEKCLFKSLWLVFKLGYLFFCC